MSKIPMLEKFAAQSLVEHDGELIFSKEKFAELIVQECLQLCINVHNDADRPFSVPGSLHCMEEIREHFGVEE